MERNITTLEDDLIAGSIYLVLSILGLVPYILCMFLILMSGELRKSSFYVLILSLGLSDIINLFGWLIFGIHLLSHGEILPQWLISIMVVSTTFGWQSGPPHFFVIAFSRYCAVCNWDLDKLLFKQRRVWIWLTVIWVVAFLCIIPEFIYGSDFIMDGHYIWYGAVEGPTGEFFFYWDLIRTILITATGTLLYGAILRVQQANKRKIATESEDRKKRNAAQMRLVVQNAVVFLLFIFAAFSYWIVVFTEPSKWVFFICAFASWALSNAINPYIYFIFNLALQREFRVKILRKPANDTVVADVSTRANKIFSTF